jgi:sialate O-acetylesterase
MVVISDLVPDTNDIHPTLKMEVANRLSNLALNQHYGFTNIACQSPTYLSYTIEKDKIRIKFNNVTTGLKATEETISCFEIAGEDKIFYPAQVKINNNTVVVFNKNIKNPLAVRFAFSNTAIPNLFNKEGLPVNLFRTDDWELDTSAIKK